MTRLFDKVGVMEDKELKLEEIEVSHTVGGTGKGLVKNKGQEGCFLS